MDSIVGTYGYLLTETRDCVLAIFDRSGKLNLLRRMGQFSVILSMSSVPTSGTPCDPKLTDNDGFWPRSKSETE